MEKGLIDDQMRRVAINSKIKDLRIPPKILYFGQKVYVLRQMRSKMQR